MDFTVIQNAATKIVDNFNSVNTEIDGLKERATDLEQEVAVLDSRMDVFTALPEGATTNDAALEDIKVGFDGTVYEGGPGDAVRAQVSQLSSEIANVEDNIVERDSGFIRPFSKYEIGLRNYQTGEINSNEKYGVSSSGTAVFDSDVELHIDSEYYGILYIYENGTYSRYQRIMNKAMYIVPSGTEFALSIRKYAEDTSATANVEEFANSVLMITNTKKEIDVISENLLFTDTAEFVNGTIAQDGTIMTYDNRVVTSGYHKFSNDTVIKVGKDFNTIKALYGDNFDLIKRKSYTGDFVFIPKNVYFRLSIYRVSEAQEVANIDEFVAHLSVVSREEFLNNSNKNYIKEYVCGVIHIDNGEIDTSYNYGWTPKEKMMFTHDVVLAIASGVYIILATYDSEGHMLTRGAKYPNYCVIKAGTIFNFTIRNYGDNDVSYDELNITSKVWIESDVRREHINYARRKPLLTITDDDGAKEFYDYLLPIIRKKGVPITSCFPSSTMPFETNERINITSNVQTMTLSELKEVQEAGGEVVGHGLVDLRTLDSEAIENELRETKRHLADYGIYTNGYAYPDGGDNEEIRYLTNKYYDYGLWRTDQEGQILSNSGNIADYRIVRFQFGGYYNIDNGKFTENNVKPYTLEAFKMALDEAIANNSWLVICLHAWLMVGENKMTEYKDIDQLVLLESAIDYAKEKGIDIVTCEEGYKMFGNAVIGGDYLGAWNTTGYSVSKTGNVDFPN